MSKDVTIETMININAPVYAGALHGVNMATDAWWKKKIRIRIHLDKEKGQVFKNLCKAEYTTMQYVLERMIDFFIDESHTGEDLEKILGKKDGTTTGFIRRAYRRHCDTEGNDNGNGNELKQAKKKPIRKNSASRKGACEIAG